MDPWCLPGVFKVEAHQAGFAGRGATCDPEVDVVASTPCRLEFGATRASQVHAMTSLRRPLEHAVGDHIRRRAKGGAARRAGDTALACARVAMP